MYSSPARFWLGLFSAPSPLLLFSFAAAWENAAARLVQAPANVQGTGSSVSRVTDPHGSLVAPLGTKFGRQAG